jgi:16S rRNA (cytidine1402-2'-O)-methyltransferase
MPAKPCLSIVAIPIGNPADITLRAIETLREVDAIICEEVKDASTLLKRLDIKGKELIVLNEHNEVELVPSLIMRMFQSNLHLALISDCGTPVFSDPGAALVGQAADFGIQVTPIPGASSLMAALSVLGVRLDHFIFAGFLPREPDARRHELTRLRGLRMPVVVMDTPYRMIAVLEDVSKTFGKGAQITLACDLTLPKESIFRGPVGEIKGQVSQRKAEFILIIHS